MQLQLLVIGLTPYLAEFDQVRYKLKQHPELPLKEKKTHDVMLKNLLTQLKLKVESLKKLTHEFETKYTFNIILHYHSLTTWSTVPY